MFATFVGVGHASAVDRMVMVYCRLGDIQVAGAGKDGTCAVVGRWDFEAVDVAVAGEQKAAY